jgi:hypothetical protein
MKRIVIILILIATASLAQANTRGELNELLGKQRQARQGLASHALVNPPGKIVMLRQSISYYRVHYSIRGNGHNITVLAESSSEARQIVMDMFPTTIVTNVHKI